MFSHYKMVVMNPSQPADGQSPGGMPPVPNRPFDMTVPPRPAAPLNIPQPRPALDSTSAPAYRRQSFAAPPQQGIPAPPQPTLTSPVPAQPAPSFTPPQPAAPAPQPSLPPRPVLRNVQTVQAVRQTPDTVYSPKAMLPGQTPEQYRQQLQQQALTQQQKAAATDHFLQSIPPPVDVPPKPVSSKLSFTRQSSEMVGKVLKTGASLAVFFGLVWGGAAVLNAFVFQSYYVDGLSMQPALSDNDRLIISKLERTRSKIESSPYIPERGQIIVIDGKVSDYTERRNEQLIKRVVGLPGDTVIIQNGIVIIKNKANPEGFNVDKILNLSLDPTFTDEPMIVTVPEDHVFVLGDNRASGGSFDSRAFGPVASEYIVGRLWARILPTDQLSVF